MLVISGVSVLEPQFTSTTAVNCYSVQSTYFEDGVVRKIVILSMVNIDLPDIGLQKYSKRDVKISLKATSGKASNFLDLRP
jgi:hypothetical protein